jgi:hypothetical protein
MLLAQIYLKLRKIKKGKRGKKNFLLMSIDQLTVSLLGTGVDGFPGIGVLMD